VRGKWIVAVVIGFAAAAPAMAGEPPVEIQSGDTLWDISGQIWGKSPEWPKLWAQNPHVHNPHWVWPGDELFLRATETPPEALVNEVRLPVERLTPPEPPKPVEPVAEPAKAKEEPAKAAKAELPPPPEPRIKFREGSVQDYVSNAPVKRVGVVEARAVKGLYAEGEDLAVALASGANPAPGTYLTVFDDSRLLRHPITDVPYGYHVRILGHVKVLDVKDGKARVLVVKSYDDIQLGRGVMAFRKPVTEVTPKILRKNVEGVVVAGGRAIELHTNQDAVFIDRGKTDGLEPGVLLDVPYPDNPPRRAQGKVVDTDRPNARMVVVSTQDRSATLYIVDDRVAVAAGQKVVTSTVSP
jgi:hypothetical protein